MSLIRCPKCGHAASDDSVRCGFCGFVLQPDVVKAEEKEKARIAAEERAREEASRQAAQPEESTYREEAKSEPEPAPAPAAPGRAAAGAKKKKSKAPVIILIILLIAALAAAGIYFLNSRGTEAEFEDAEDVTTEEIDEGFSTDDVTVDDGETVMEEDEGVTVDNGSEEFYDPAEDGGTDDNGAEGGMDVTDDDPYAEEE